MKKTIILSIAALLAFSSCDEKLNINTNHNIEGSGEGYLSFAGWELTVDDEVEKTKASEPADGSYAVIINSKSDESASVVTTYQAVKEAGNKISLAAGEYSVTARSKSEDVPAAKFDYPVYGVQKDVTIESGKVTELGEMVCKLLQTKVTIDYSDEFLAMVTGDCTATVSVSPTAPLTYNIQYVGGKASYDHRAGYFAVNNGGNTTMEVFFKGNVEGGQKTMSQSFSNIKPCTWHQIKFVKKVSEDGTADIDIVIEDLVEDVELKDNINGSESIIGDDPDAPKGDGGIMLESTCNYDITQPIVVPAKGNSFVLTMKATIPNKVLKFSVDIISTSPDFVDAVKIINNGSATLDLVDPSSGAISVFTTIIPFPYGAAVAGKSEISFDLSDAQVPILAFKGTHTFSMNVMDQQGCKKTINVTMIVE